MKKIMAELWFGDDFTPPEYFVEPYWGNNFESECKNCPLFSWVDDCDGMSCGDCHFPGEWVEKDGKYLCPIRKYFI